MGAEVAVGSTFAQRYRLLELVGRGANASVYLADDLTLRRRVAVKILNESLAQNPAFLQRFEQEMRAASALNLPRLVHLHDWGLEPSPHTVNEFIDGGSLAAVLGSGQVMTPSQALFVGLEVARGLVNLHARGHAHLGITASSILFDTDDRVFISDLGLAPALSAARSRTSAHDEADGSSVTGSVLDADAAPSSDDEADQRACEDAVGDAGSVSSRPEDAVGDAVGDAERVVSYSSSEQAHDVRALAIVINEAVTGLRWPSDDVESVPFAPSLVAGPMQEVLQRAVASDPHAGLDAAGMAEELLRVAGLLPRPEPLPLTLQDDLTTELAVMSVPSNASTAAADIEPAPAARVSPAALLDEVPRRRWPGVLLAALVVLGGSAGGVWAWVQNRPETVTMPDLVGETRETAVAAAERLGRQVEVILVRQSGTEPGEVVRIEPAADTELTDRDVALVFFVSLGEPLVAVGELDSLVFGKSVSEAVELLAEAGFEVSGETLAAHELIAAGTVLGIDTGVSEDVDVFELAPGAKVRLLVSEGPAALP